MINNTESVTAKLCSFARAYHSNFERDKIFDDYLAYDLLGRGEYEEVGQLIENNYKKERFNAAHLFKSANVRQKLNKYIAPIPLSRAAFAEGALKEFVALHGKCQYVICGAGMDTFIFRNDNPNIKIFEIDHPDTQRYKLERIKKLKWNIPQNAKYVPVDFSKDEMTKKLKEAGYDTEIPSFFSILGVTYYLTLSVFEKTIMNIAQISPFGSNLVFDFPDDTTFGKNTTERVRTLSKITKSLGETMQHGYSVNEVKEALYRHNFSLYKYISPKNIQKQFFENRTDNQKAYENIHFILAKKDV